MRATLAFARNVASRRAVLLDANRGSLSCALYVKTTRLLAPPHESATAAVRLCGVHPSVPPSETHRERRSVCSDRCVIVCRVYHLVFSVSNVTVVNRDFDQDTLRQKNFMA